MRQADPNVARAKMMARGRIAIARQALEQAHRDALQGDADASARARQARKDIDAATRELRDLGPGTGR